MKALIFTKESDARTAQSEQDVGLGYPKLGVDIGGGIHVPPAMSVTRTFAAPEKHPKQEKWALRAADQGKAGAVELDATWVAAVEAPKDEEPVEGEVGAEEVKKEKAK